MGTVCYLKASLSCIFVVLRTVAAFSSSSQGVSQCFCLDPTTKNAKGRSSTPNMHTIWSHRSRNSGVVLYSTDDDSARSAPRNQDDLLRPALSKMDTVMRKQFFESNSALQAFHNKIVKHVEVKTSHIQGAGLGLFATKNIKANTIVSFYPAHALGTDSSEPSSPSQFVALSDQDVEYFRQHPSARSSYLHCTDQPMFERLSILQNSNNDSNNEPLYLDVNPERAVDAGWVSQYINDGAVIHKHTEEGVLDYYAQSKAAKNCIHIPFGPSPILATVTTTKVKKGQELLTSYGGTYWLGVWQDGDDGAEDKSPVPVPVTPAIQTEIQETANDLRTSMKTVAVVYQNQLEALQAEFANIPVPLLE